MEPGELGVAEERHPPRQSIERINAGYEQPRPRPHFNGRNEMKDMTEAEARERNRADTAERADNECHELNVRLSNLLTGIANALKGKPEPLHSHDWSDLPECAAKVEAEVARMRPVVMAAAADADRWRGCVGQPAATTNLIAAVDTYRAEGK